MANHIENLVSILQIDDTLTNAIDQLIAESPRSDVDLNGPHRTIVCVYDKGTIENKFLSVWRDAEKTDLTLVIEVLSSMGDTNSYCENVVTYIVQMLSDLTTLQDTGWILHIRSTIVDVIPHEQHVGQWKGTITMSCNLFSDA